MIKNEKMQNYAKKCTFEEFWATGLWSNPLLIYGAENFWWFMVHQTACWGTHSLLDCCSPASPATCTMETGPLTISMLSWLVKPLRPLSLAYVTLGWNRTMVENMLLKITRSHIQLISYAVQTVWVHEIPYQSYPQSPASLASKDMNGTRLRLVCIGTKGDWVYLRKATRHD